MMIATTIQITVEEDREISYLREAMGLASKKEVVREGIKALRQILQEENRRQRLRVASFSVRADSKTINKEWASHSTAVTAP